MRRFAPFLVGLIIGLATLTAYAQGWFTRSAGLSASDLFRRSLTTMDGVRSVHSSGRYTEREVEVEDMSSAGAWRIQGACIRQGSATITRFLYQGRQTGRHPRSVDEEYLVRATPYQANPYWWWRHWLVCVRSAHPGGAWRRVVVTHDARIVSSMCPSLVVSLLRQRLPGPLVNLGRTRVGGRSVVHLQSSFDGQGGGATDDLYVDPVTSRWVRVRLSGWGAGCCHAEAATFDFSQYDAIKAIPLPKRRSGSLRERK